MTNERKQAMRVIRNLQKLRKDAVFMRIKATLNLNDPVILSIWKNN